MKFAAKKFREISAEEREKFMIDYRTDLEAYKKAKSELKPKMTADQIQAKISKNLKKFEFKSNVNEFKPDMNEFKPDMNELKSNVNELKSNVNEFKSNMTADQIRKIQAKISKNFETRPKIEFLTLKDLRPLAN